MRAHTLPAGPAALIAGRDVAWSDLLPLLGESAGRESLRELALDHALEQRCLEQGIAIGPEHIQRERELLARSLTLASDQSQPNTPDTSSLAWLQIRNRRGLGPVRESALLRRSAMLRALVATDTDVDPDSLQLARQIASGPRIDFRALVVPDRALAHRLHSELQADQPQQRNLRFAQLAFEHSTDLTRDRGGLELDASPFDPTLEAPVRDALLLLRPGELSDPIALGPGRWALILPISTRPTPQAAEPAEIHQALILRQQRLRMDALALQMLEQTRVEPLDPALAWSWNNPPTP